METSTEPCTGKHCAIHNPVVPIWNYRITRRVEDGEPIFEIREIYYDEKGEVESWTVEAVAPYATSAEEMILDLAHMVSAAGLPIIDLDELGISVEQRSDKEIVEIAGVRLTNVHPAADCEGRPCVIHNPSEHHMRDWPLVWRDGKGLFERTCEHGVGHTDPDDQAYYRSIDMGEMTVHGCDGCCFASSEEDEADIDRAIERIKAAPQESES